MEKQGNSFAVLRRSFLWAAVLAVAMYFTWCIAFQASGDLHVMRAVAETSQQGIRKEALVVRNERPLSYIAGEYAPVADEGARLSSGDVYAYRTYADTEAFFSYTLQEEQFAAIEALSDKSIREVNASVLSEIKKLPTAGGSIATSARQDRISSLLSRRWYLLSSDSDLTRQQDYVSMLKENYLRACQSSGEPLYASTPGYYSSYSDGLEEELTSDRLESLSASELSEMISSQFGRECSYAPKMVTDYRWWLLFTGTEEEASLLREGKTYSATVGQRNISLTLQSIKEDESNPEEYIFVFLCKDNVTEFLTSRVLGVELLLSRQSGYRIPAQACSYSEEEQSYYIFTLRGYIVKKIYVNLVENEGESVLISCDSNSLFPGDWIFTRWTLDSGSELHDGAVVRGIPTAQ